MGNEPNSFTAWAKNACKRDEIDGIRSKNLRAQLDDCFHLIRFGAIEIKKLSQYLLRNELRDFFTTGELEDIIFATSGKSFKSDHINRVPRTPSLNSRELICTLSTQSHCGSRYYIKNTESVYFSTNVPLLLGRFDCSCIHGPRNVARLKVSMFENDSKDSASHSSLSMYSEDVQKHINPPYTHTFPKIMVIKPRKVYEIRLENSPNNGCYYINKMNSNFTVNLDSGVSIEFHDGANNGRSGLIPKLYFNRL